MKLILPILGAIVAATLAHAEERPVLKDLNSLNPELKPLFQILKSNIDRYESEKKIDQYSMVGLDAHGDRGFTSAGIKVDYGDFAGALFIASNPSKGDNFFTTIINFSFLVTAPKKLDKGGIARVRECLEEGGFELESSRTDDGDTHFVARRWMKIPIGEVREDRIRVSLDSSVKAMLGLRDLGGGEFSFVTGEKAAVTKMRNLLRGAKLPYVIMGNDSYDFLVPLNFKEEGRRQRVFLKFGISEKTGKEIISMESIAINKPSKPSEFVRELCKNEDEKNPNSGWRIVDAGKEFMLQRMTICNADISEEALRAAIIGCGAAADDMEIKLSEKDEW